MDLRGPTSRGRRKGRGREARGGLPLRGVKRKEGRGRIGGDGREGCPVSLLSRTGNPSRVSYVFSKYAISHYASNNFASTHAAFAPFSIITLAYDVYDARA